MIARPVLFETLSRVSNGAAFFVETVPLHFGADGMGGFHGRRVYTFTICFIDILLQWSVARRNSLQRASREREFSVMKLSRKPLRNVFN